MNVSVYKNVVSALSGAAYELLLALPCQHRTFATSSETTSQSKPKKKGLDANQISAIEDAARAACASATQATQLATLTTMTGAYRDASVAMEGLYVQRVLKRDPLTAQPVPSQPPLPADSDSVSSIFPVVDVTQLSDADPSVPQGPQQYNQQYMDRITCWQQTQPSHVETSTMLRTGISLFPPQEVTYPTYIDFQAATRLLEKHKSRKRLGLFKKLSKYQDKYQLKTWDHRKGE